MLTLGALLAGCAVPVSPDGDPVSLRSGTEAVASLTVARESDADSYRRAAFGQRWLDTDHNGCDTRNDVLARDLDDVRYRQGSRCVVVSGTLDDPYTGREVRFVKGGDSEVDIDHVVPLAEAWRSGAAQWDVDRRKEFANDPDNLLATWASVNRGKGDQDPGAWLPANRSRACRYVARVAAVKEKWELSVDRIELDSMREVLGGC
jgi:hypothetical protein